MAAYIGAISTLWECNEEHWGIILADALHADARIGVELYLALTGSAAQNSVMIRAMELSVEDPSLRQEFAELLTENKKRAKERNAVVHGRWGILPTRAGALVLGERNWLPKTLANLNHNYAKAEAAGERYNPSDHYPQTLWTKKDFENVIERLRLFGGKQIGFTLKVERARNERLQKEHEARSTPPNRLLGLLGQSSERPKPPPKTSPTKPLK